MGGDQSVLDEAVRSLRVLILAGENYRQAVALWTGLGVTETQALSYLAVHGDLGQNQLGAELGITSSASTALVDRLESQGVAERYAHPGDRRRSLVRLTTRGDDVVQQSHDWLAASFGEVASDTLPGLAVSLRQIADSLRAQSDRMSSRP